MDAGSFCCLRKEKSGFLKFLRIHQSLFTSTDEADGEGLLSLRVCVAPFTQVTPTQATAQGCPCDISWLPPSASPYRVASLVGC